MGRKGKRGEGEEWRVRERTREGKELTGGEKRGRERKANGREEGLRHGCWGMDASRPPCGAQLAAICYLIANTHYCSCALFLSVMASQFIEDTGKPSLPVREFILIACPVATVAY